MSDQARLICQPYKEGFSLHLTFHDRDLYLSNMIGSEEDKHLPDGEPFECIVDNEPYYRETHEHAKEHGCWFSGVGCPFGKGWLPSKYEGKRIGS